MSNKMENPKKSPEKIHNNPAHHDMLVPHFTIAESKKFISRINDLLLEIERNEKYKEELAAKSKKLFNDYQKGKYSAVQYNKLLNILLQGKTLDDWLDYYGAYIYSLLSQIEAINSGIFYAYYNDKQQDYIAIKETAKPVFEESVPELKILEKLRAEEQIIPKTLKISSETGHVKKAVQKAEEKKTEQKHELKAEKEEIKHEKTKEIHEEIKHIETKHAHGISVQSPFTFILSSIKNMFSSKKKQSAISSETTMPTSVLRWQIIKRKLPMEEKAGKEFSSTAMSEEAKRIKAILESRKAPKIYSPSFLGSIANITLRKLSFFLLDNFPDFFKQLYNSLRLANIRILSNTYVNIMLLSSMLVSLFSLLFFATFFYFLGQPITLVLVKSIIMTLIAAAITLIAFYMYPQSKIKSRRRNINANLPFAINHMSAIAASGVPPARMFKLIAQSAEYGDVSIELEKIVEYTDLFGYDLTTAIKSVSATCPSPALKEFFDGLLSTVQSGGEIKDFMSEKSSEALLSYQLERQKYVENVSTYSDIYTGILIAAPLFFVLALSLVSMLGGAVGGIAVDTLIVMGTYVAIPILNILFILFLEMTQPEI